MKAYVYILVKPDGKVCYAGKSINLKARTRWHKWHKKDRKLKLIVVSTHKTEDAALRAEQKLVQLLKTAGLKLFNTMSPSLVSGFHHSEKTKRLISKKLTGKKRTLEARRKQSRSAKGRIFTLEHRAKLSEAMRQRVWTGAMRKKASEAHKGLKLSPRTRRKVSAIVKSWWSGPGGQKERRRRAREGRARRS